MKETKVSDLIKLDKIFDMIYIINLDDMVDRWKLCQKELKTFGLTRYQRFSGIKVNDGVEVKDREKGCKLSHINIVKEAKEKNYKSILILEDDIVFYNEFEKYVPIINNFIKNNEWNLFYLGGNHKEEPLETSSDNIVQVVQTLTTHAYAIHNSCYDIFLSGVFIKPGNAGIPIDTVLYREIQKLGKSYAIKPKILYQKDGYSYIRGGFRNYKILQEGGEDTIKKEEEEKEKQRKEREKEEEKRKKKELKSKPHIPRKGYILFHCILDETNDFEMDPNICKTILEVEKKWEISFAEAFTDEKRHLIHYFYLDLQTMLFNPLQKWKLPYINKKDDALNSFKNNSTETETSLIPEVINL